MESQIVQEMNQQTSQKQTIDKCLRGDHVDRPLKHCKV